MDTRKITVATLAIQVDDLEQRVEYLETPTYKHIFNSVKNRLATLKDKGARIFVRGNGFYPATQS